jgi:hypothetical protein
MALIAHSLLYWYPIDTQFTIASKIIIKIFQRFMKNVGFASWRQAESRVDIVGKKINKLLASSICA